MTQDIASRLAESERNGRDSCGIATNPATGEVIGHYALSDIDEIRAMITTARQVFDGTDWRHDRIRRVSALNAFADAMTARRDDLIRTLSLENGKLIPEAAFEVDLTLTKIRYNAALALTLADAGHAAEAQSGLFSIVAREPIGVAGIIVPWNAPVILNIRSLAPALAAGCTAVVKTAPQTALTSQIIFECLNSVDAIAPGTVSFFTETGSAGARELITSAEVNIISYTGSSATGRAIMAAGAPQLKRMNLELGGKNPCVIFEDADLTTALPQIIQAGTLFAGQFCMQGSRVLVQRSIAKDVQDKLATALADLRVGPADDESSQMGPLIDIASRTRVCDAVAAAEDAGRYVIKGSVPKHTPPEGAFLTPSLIEVANPRHPIVQNEIFGPVVTFEVFDDEAHAVELANATNYGLSASVWTENGDRASRISRSIRAGTVWTNLHSLILDQFEEGGFKQSGLGRLNGVGGMETFLETKHMMRPITHSELNL